MTKPQIRTAIKQKREAMSVLELRAKSLIIQEKAIEFLMNEKLSKLVSYAGFNGEVESQFLNGFMLEQRVDLGLPVVDKKDLIFRRVLSLKDDLRIGNYGIPEPKDNCECLHDKMLYHAIIPGVAFDKRGVRVGYGKGYYDRFLLAHPGIYRVGLAFHWQIVDYIEADPHDQGMDMVISDKGVYTYTRMD